MNHCPVYTRSAATPTRRSIPGPIGKILTPQMEGVGLRHELPHASSLCGACAEVCPVGIPIPEMLVRLRREATPRGPGSTCREGHRPNGHRGLAWRIWAMVLERPALYRVATWFATRFGSALPAGCPLIRNWTRSRSKPVPARRSLQERMRAEGVPHV